MLEENLVNQIKKFQTFIKPKKYENILRKLILKKLNKFQ